MISTVPSSRAASSEGQQSPSRSITLTCHGSGGLTHTLLFLAMGVALAVACAYPRARWRSRAIAG